MRQFHRAKGQLVFGQSFSMLVSRYKELLQQAGVVIPHQSQVFWVCTQRMRRRAAVCWDMGQCLSSPCTSTRLQGLGAAEALALHC